MFAELLTKIMIILLGNIIFMPDIWKIFSVDELE
jgi:hypothetical protein